MNLLNSINYIDNDGNIHTFENVTSLSILREPLFYASDGKYAKEHITLEFFIKREVDNSRVNKENKSNCYCCCKKCE